MSQCKTSSPTRRQWCQTVLRWTALGGIAALSAVLLGRDRSPSDCPRESAVCRGCAALSDCHLPQAIAEKRRPRM